MSQMGVATATTDQTTDGQIENEDRMVITGSREPERSAEFVTEIATDTESGRETSMRI